MMKTFLNDPKRFVPLFLFCFYLLLGLAIAPAYGISWDEPAQDRKAELNLKYISGRSDALLKYPDRHYNSLVPILLNLPARLTEDSQAQYFMRHQLNFLLFFTSVLVFFNLFRRNGFSAWLALAGAALLVTHPQIFAHSFYNPKDIPFLGMVVVGLYTLMGFLKAPSVRTALLHGLVCGLMVVFRLPGVIIAPVSLLAVVFLLPGGLRREGFGRMVWLLALMGVAAALALYIFMPALWHDPIRELRTFLSMKLFVHEKISEFFFGQWINDQPWYFVPAFVAVTTPPMYLLLAMLGAGWAFGGLRRNGVWQWPGVTDERTRLAMVSLIYLACTAAAALFSKQNVVINGWRHYFFVYPLLVVLMVFALGRLVTLAGQLGWLRNGAFAALAVQFCLVMVFLVQAHPYQFAYFNIFAGGSLQNASKLFPMDYWGLAYRDAMEKILAAEPDGEVKIKAEETKLAQYNLLILPTKDRERVTVLPENSPEVADYYITGFTSKKGVPAQTPTLFSQISLRGAVISATYKR